MSMVEQHFLVFSISKRTSNFCSLVCNSHHGLLFHCHVWKLLPNLASIVLLNRMVQRLGYLLFSLFKMINNSMFETLYLVLFWEPYIQLIYHTTLGLYSNWELNQVNSLNSIGLGSFRSSGGPTEFSYNEANDHFFRQ